MKMVFDVENPLFLQICWHFYFHLFTPKPTVVYKRCVDLAERSSRRRIPRVLWTRRAGLNSAVSERQSRNVSANVAAGGCCVIISVRIVWIAIGLKKKKFFFFYHVPMSGDCGLEIGERTNKHAADSLCPDESVCVTDQNTADARR